MRFGKKHDRKIAGDDPNPFSLYFLILCLLSFLFSLLCAVWHSKRVSPHRTSAPRASDLEIYFYVFPYCVPASLFIFFKTCRLAKNTIAKSQETIQIHFLCIFLFCACYPFYFLYFVPFGIPNESLHIAPPPHVRVTLKYILCISLLCAG